MQTKIKIRERMKLLRKREILKGNAPYSAAHLFLKNINFKKNSIIGLYWPILYELDTRPLIKVLSIKNLILALPLIKNQSMIFKKWDCKDPLFYTPHRFYAPSGDASSVKPNILIIPMLAFDSLGYRLGYGKGYYDKYYSSNKTLNYCGYGFDAQFISCLPQEQHDLKFNSVITEKKIYAF